MIKYNLTLCDESMWDSSCKCSCNITEDFLHCHDSFSRVGSNFLKVTMQYRFQTVLVVGLHIFIESLSTFSILSCNSRVSVDEVGKKSNWAGCKLSVADCVIPLPNIPHQSLRLVRSNLTLRRASSFWIFNQTWTENMWK